VLREIDIPWGVNYRIYVKLHFCCRLWGFLVVGLVSAHAQSLTNYAWTDVPAFPGLSVTNPVAITTPPGETNRLFIVQQGGIFGSSIIVISNLDVPTNTTFLNLPQVIGGGESGFLGMAFHPGYATNRYFYVFYTTLTNYNTPRLYWDVLSRFQTSASNPNQADASSEVRLFVQLDRNENHNAGDVHFGPDGYLYVSVGDEGGEGNAYNNAQRIDSNLFSGILRIDVDKLPGSLPPNPSPTFATTTNYAIPPDNPFVGATNFDGLPVDPAHVRTEFWAVGLRNPWRFSFDPVTGFLYCGDVGQDTMEEVDVLTNGGNGGWPFYEGSLHAGPTISNVTVPIISYYHGTNITNGSAVIGGVVYRGNRFPQLNGAYIFGDWVRPRVWGSFYDGTNATPPVYLSASSSPRCFGTDPRNGDILYADSGSIRRILSLTPEINSFTYSSTNLIIRGAGGTAGRFIDLFASTDLSVPFTNWTFSVVSVIDAQNNFAFTNSIDPATPQMFYRLR
jgi:glucose/arabinose dehydrogenase